MPLTTIETLLHHAMGLHSSTVGSSTVSQAVSGRMRVCAIQDTIEYLALLNRSERELNALIEAVIIPETWFFRDYNPFVAFSNWVRENCNAFTPDNPLKILSLPCSSGEEPYTLAMCLSDSHIPLACARIEGIDISLKNLEKARSAVYGTNSFRGSDHTYRTTHFYPVGNHYQLHENITERVTFEQGNLLDCHFSRHKGKYHVVFCRNLLIYFDRPTQHRAIDRLDQLLLPDGLLFVGHSETSLLKNRSFVALDHPRCFGFKKLSPEAEQSDIPLAARRRKNFSPPQTKPFETRVPCHFPPAPDTSTGDQSDTPPTASAPIADAFRLADEGHLDEAAQLCETLLLQQHCPPDAYYLLGVIREAAGNIDDAQQLFRKAVYLEPDHVEALTHLSVIASRSGDNQSAQRFLDRAVRAQAARTIRTINNE